MVQSTLEQSMVQSTLEQSMVHGSEHIRTVNGSEHIRTVNGSEHIRTVNSINLNLFTVFIGDHVEPTYFTGAIKFCFEKATLNALLFCEHFRCYSFFNPYLHIRPTERRVIIKFI